jgi:hypothetical protein
MIEWILNWCARPVDRRNRSFMDGLMSNAGTEDEVIGTQRGTTERSTDKTEDCDE